MELIKKGAEAELYRVMYNGQPAVLKRRVPKRYRVPELDEGIRKMRTRREARLLERARRAGINAPIVYRVDHNLTEIFMQYVEGEQVKDYLMNGGKADIMRRIGECVATLHENNIVHGDLTTSNIILHNSDIFFIDFGLGSFSTSVEDMAVDLLCFKRSFTATHSEIADSGWNAFLGGYLQYSRASEVLSRLEQVIRRARYL